MAEEPDNGSKQRLDGVLRTIGVLVLIVFIAVLPVIAFTDWIRADVRSMMLLQHPGPFLALPGAGVFALLIVSIFQITHGDIEFEIGTPLRLTLKGAAGPILMWIVAYLAIAFSMYLLW